MTFGITGTAAFDPALAHQFILAGHDIGLGPPAGREQ
jgi:hypothetical protein